jgi:hypothetical protein
VIFTRGIGYPDSFHPSANGDVLHSIELLYLAHKVMRGLLAVEVDTFLIYKLLSADITETCPFASVLFADNNASKPAYQKEWKKYESNYIYTM